MIPTKSFSDVGLLLVELRSDVAAVEDPFSLDVGKSEGQDMDRRRSSAQERLGRGDSPTHHGSRPSQRLSRWRGAEERSSVLIVAEPVGR